MTMQENHLLFVFLLFVTALQVGNCSITEENQNDMNDENEQKTKADITVQFDDIEMTIKKLENAVTSAEKAHREGIVPLEYIEEFQNQIFNKLDDIGEYVKDLTNAYNFFNAYGIERVIITNIGNNDNKIIKALLLIIKTLFDVAPTTTMAKMPMGVVDKLLDIFENKNSSTLKVMALDIMYVWFPNNPKVQARVMETKGLEPFYDQILKFDPSTSNRLLDLFNIILQEHILVRNIIAETTEHDHIDYKVYQMIGLIERMSTPAVCNGLLSLLVSSTSKGGLSLPVYKLVKNVEQFCLKTYKGKPKAINFFTNVYESLSNENITLLNSDLNFTSEKEELKHFLEKINPMIRNEL